MARNPPLTTICTACKREDVGVVLDWAYRDGNDQLIPNRYRLARHKVVFGTKDKSVPWCINSRNIVPKELVFDSREQKGTVDV